MNYGKLRGTRDRRHPSTIVDLEAPCDDSHSSKSRGRTARTRLKTPAGRLGGHEIVVFRSVGDFKI